MARVQRQPMQLKHRDLRLQNCKNQVIIIRHWESSSWAGECPTKRRGACHRFFWFLGGLGVFRIFFCSAFSLPCELMLLWPIVVLLPKSMRRTLLLSMCTLTWMMCLQFGINCIPWSLPRWEFYIETEVGQHLSLYVTSSTHTHIKHELLPLFFQIYYIQHFSTRCQTL